jgi:hypothetical protein
MDANVSADRTSVRAIFAAGTMTSPRRVSAFGLAVTIHLVAFVALAWALDQPVPMPMPRGTSAARSRSASEGEYTSRPSPRDQRSRQARSSNTEPAAPARDTGTPEPRRVLDLLRDGAIVVAARIGLMSAPQSGASQGGDASPDAGSGIALVPLPPGTRFITGEVPDVLLLGDAYKVQAYPLLARPGVMWIEVPDISRRAIRERRPTVGWWSLDAPLVQRFKLVAHLRTLQLPAPGARGADDASARPVDALIIDAVSIIALAR